MQECPGSSSSGTTRPPKQDGSTGPVQWTRYPPGKHLAARERARRRAMTLAADRSDVRALQDVVVVHEVNAEKKFNVSRKERHDRVVDQYHQRKRGLFAELECQVESLSEQLRVEMDQSQSRLDREFGRLVDDVLIEMELSDFEGLWETVEREFASREATWVQFEADLQTIERRRQVDMSSEIQAVVAELVDIGFQLPEEIEKDFEPEVNSVNELIVSNRVAFLDLIARLRVADVRLKDRQNAIWEGRRGAWKTLRHRRCMEIARAELNSPEWVNPGSRRRILDGLIDEQTRIFESAQHLMQGLRSLVPPALSVNNVQQIQKEVANLLQVSGDMCNSCLAALAADGAAKRQRVQARTEQLFRDLAAYGAATEDEIRTQVANEITTIVTQQDANAIRLVDEVSAVLVREEVHLHKKLGAAVKFYQTAAELWGRSLKAVDDLELAITETYMRRRDAYTDDLAAMEKRLEAVTDGLRQAANNETLTAAFDEARGIVGPGGLLEKCHIEFNKESIDIAGRHLPALRETIEKVKDEVASVFGLQAMPATGPDQVTSPALVAFLGASYNVDKTPSQIVDQIMAEFNTGDMAAGTSVPLDPDGKPCAVICTFEVECFVNCLLELRTAFISSLENISKRETDRVNAQHAYRLEELSTDFDTVMRLHTPRLTRLEVDVVGVRSAELKGNLERFHRYWTRFDTILGNGQAAFTTGCERAEAMIAKRSRLIDQMKNDAVQAKTMSGLQRLRNQAKAVEIEFVSQIEAQIHSTETVLNDLKTQMTSLSSQFLASCIPFGAPQGTYCQEEIDKYGKEVAIIDDGATRTFETLTSRLAALKKDVVEQHARKDFDETSNVAQNDMAVVLGLGYRFGAPKRRASARLREEFNLGSTRCSDIERLLKEIETMTEEKTEDGKADASSATEASSLTCRMLRALIALRYRFEECGKVFGVTKSVGTLEDVPVLPGPGTNDSPGPPPAKLPTKAPTAPSASSPLSSVLTWATVIAKVEEACKQEMTQLCKEYYEKNAGRLQMPADLMPVAVVKHLESEKAIAATKLAEFQQTFRELVIRFDTIKTWLPKRVLHDVLERSRHETQSRLSMLRDQFRQDVRRIAQQHRNLELRLKPGISRQALLDMTNDAVACHQAAVSDIETKRSQLQNEVQRCGREFAQRVAHCSQALVKLFDTTVNIERVDFGSEENAEATLAEKKRMGLKRLVRKAGRDASATSSPSAPTDKKGKPAPASQGNEKVKVYRAPEGQIPGWTTLLPDVACASTEPNRVVFTNRDKIWAAMQAELGEHTAAVEKECKAALDAEQQWNDRWQRDVQYLQTKMSPS